MVPIVTMPRLMAVGGGALAELPAMLRRLGLSRPLVVTDPYIKSCGILDQATELLDGAQIRWSVFADTVPDPTTTAVEAGTHHQQERLAVGLRAGDRRNRAIAQHARNCWG